MTPPPRTHAGSGERAPDAREVGASLAARFRRQADSLERGGRSPLCVRVMRDAADDAAAGGRVVELFDGVPVPPGSVPALRLLGALHCLVLGGRAPALAEFYPSAGGPRAPDGIWPVVAATVDEHFAWLHERMGRTVQTNEPGRAAVLFSALLWLTERFGLPIRLLEIGASAGLNLLVDRFCYRVDGQALGDPDSPVQFANPWSPPPAIDLGGAAHRLALVEREGCDLAPLDPTDPEDRTTALSYIWPDEADRLARVRAALELAARHPPPVSAERAGTWLPARLADRPDGVLTVVWHSVFRQYLPPQEWRGLQDAYTQAAGASGEAPVVWLGMEPGDDHISDMRLTIRTRPEEPERQLAWCGDHGPPVRWL